MVKKENVINKIIEFISFKIISPFNWTRVKFLITGRAFDLKPIDREYARDLCKDDVLVWVTRRETHLTSYLISASDFALAFLVWAKEGFKGTRPKFSFWAHAFMNVDDNEFIEAVAKGVQKVYFDYVFDVDAAAALVPAELSLTEWRHLKPFIKAELELQKGKGYDATYNIKDESKVSCIEVILVVLRHRVPDYSVKFANLEKLINTYKNITPQMLIDSGSFKVIWEVRY